MQGLPMHVIHKGQVGITELRRASGKQKWEALIAKAAVVAKKGAMAIPESTLERSYSVSHVVRMPTKERMSCGPSAMEHRRKESITGVCGTATQANAKNPSGKR